jgi:DNA repair exonuclease SbcCD ATPase subunit
MDLNNLRIIRLEAENVKRLHAVTITPDGHLVEIAGNNAQGKTSVLDAIMWGLGGTKGIQAEPIRRGADKARIEIVLGNGTKTELIVERKFTEKNSARGGAITVKTADGMSPSNPQELLNSLLGKLTFDPLDFMRRDARNQAEILRSMVKIDIDLDRNAADREAAFDARTEVNREAKSLRAQASAIVVDCPADAQPINESSLLSQMENAAGINADIQRRKTNRELAVQEIERQRSDAKEKREQAARLIDEAETLEAAAKRTENNIAAAGELKQQIDLSDIRSELDAAKKINAALAEKARRDKLVTQAKAKEDESAALTKKIDALDAAKIAAIKAAKMPVPGLGLGVDCVTYNGLPLDQASDAEQLKVSTAIAAALNPKLRVIRIRDGSLLDQDSMAWLAHFAEDRDMQVWVETVGNGNSPSAIVIEDGHVRGQEVRQAAE